MIGRPAVTAGVIPENPKRQGPFVDEDLNHPNRVLLADVISRLCGSSA